jgi:hypothetical protein
MPKIVYVVSRLSLLGDRRIGRAQDFGLYIVWQGVAISVASVLVAIIAHLAEPAMASLGAVTGPGGGDIAPITLASGLAKAVVTPLTLLANFLFMKWLTGKRTPAAATQGGAQ